MNATSIEPARPASEHLVSLSHHSYLIRSVRGSDELALFDMFARSSPEDLRLRCLGMIKDFPRLAAARLARCDRDREIALVAVDGEGAAPGEIVGVAHLIEEPAEPGCAEFDILVRTDVKGHGVGFQLMKDVLARARERRLTKIVGFIAGENHAMLLKTSELGFVRETHAEMGTVRVTAMLWFVADDKQQLRPPNGDPNFETRRRTVS